LISFGCWVRMIFKNVAEWTRLMNERTMEKRKKLILQNKNALSFKMNSHDLIKTSKTRRISAKRNQSHTRVRWPFSSHSTSQKRPRSSNYVVFFIWPFGHHVSIPKFLIECDGWLNKGQYNFNWSQLCLFHRFQQHNLYCFITSDEQLGGDDDGDDAASDVFVWD
jgi:hypothetical protein